MTWRLRCKLLKPRTLLTQDAIAATEAALDLYLCNPCDYYINTKDLGETPKSSRVLQ